MKTIVLAITIMMGIQVRAQNMNPLAQIGPMNSTLHQGESKSPDDSSPPPAAEPIRMARGEYTISKLKMTRTEKGWEFKLEEVCSGSTEVPVYDLTKDSGVYGSGIETVCEATLYGKPEKVKMWASIANVLRFPDFVPAKIFAAAIYYTDPKWEIGFRSITSTFQTRTMDLDNGQLFMQADVDFLGQQSQLEYFTGTVEILDENQ